MHAPMVYPQYFVTDTHDEVVEDIVPTTADGAYPGAFPSYVGIEADNNSATDRFDLSVSEWPEASTGAFVDRSIGAEMGAVNTNPYSIYGPVSPNSVENFDLLGTVINNPRQAEYANGHVGDLDYMSYTAQQLAAQQSPEANADEVLAQLLASGGAYPVGY